MACFDSVLFMYNNLFCVCVFCVVSEGRVPSKREKTKHYPFALRPCNEHRQRWIESVTFDKIVSIHWIHINVDIEVLH